MKENIDTYPRPILTDMSLPNSDTHNQDTWLSHIPTAHQIPRTTADNFLVNNYDPKLPCIITGLHGWKCGAWTPESLSTLYASYTHTFRYSDSTSHDSCFISLLLKDYMQTLFIDNNIDQLPTPPSASEKVKLFLLISYLNDLIHSLIYIFAIACACLSLLSRERMYRFLTPVISPSVKN